MKVEGKVGGRREQRHGEVRTALGRRGFAGCLVVGAGGGARKARLWSLHQRRRGSCRGCMLGVGVEGRLASLGDGCRLRYDGEGDRAIACLRVDVEVGLARLVVEVEEAEAVEDSSVVCLMKESTLGLHYRLSHTDEAILEDAQERHCGKSQVVLLFEVKVVETRRMVSDSVIPAYLALGPCYQGRSFVCCRVNPGHRPVLSILPYGVRYLVAWRKRRGVQDYQDPVRASECG